MSYKLVIAEKPSVAHPIAKVIGTICIYFHANIYYHISMKGECI